MSTIPQIDPDTLRRQLAIAIPPPQPSMAAPSVTAGNAPPVLSSTQKQASLDSVKPAPQGVQMSSPAAPSLPAPSPLSIKAPRGSIQGDQEARANSLQEGPGIENIAHKIEGTQFGQNHPLLGKIAGYGLQVPAMIGDIAAETASPISRLALSHVPGTFAHQADTLRGENQAIDQDVTNEAKQAQTANLQQQPALKEEQISNTNEIAQNKLEETQRLHDQQLREHGFKLDETGKVIPLPYAEMSEPQRAVQDLKGSQEELADATAALKKVQADPNSPQARMAQQRIDNAQQTRAIALQRLGLSQATFDARYHGTDTSGQALPGAMLTDTDKPVGSSFSANVRPTGQERNKADMANSAAKQIDDMKSIVSRRPDIFGPAAGRTTDFKVWLGSQDPDAQRFRAARTIAGDHLAGTFGGRSEAALTALDNALGQFKDNPKAALAGLDQLAGANTSFQKAGTVHTAGAQPKAEPPQSSGKSVSLKDAMALPRNKDKSEADVRKDIEALGYQVTQ